MAPVLRRLQTSREFQSTVCVTAQHGQLLEQMLHEFQIHPDYSLGDRRPGTDLNGLVGWMLSGLGDVLRRARPDVVLVQGDTASVLAGAMAASLSNIPLAHIEAGLRTGDTSAPFPEELIRVTVARLATYHFATTSAARGNLLREGIPAEQVFLTGSTGIDALQEAIRTTRTWNARTLRERLGPALCSRVLDRNRRLILVTGHRRENLSQRLANVCTAIADMAAGQPDWDFVFPVHLNPLVQRQVREILGKSDNVSLLPPMGYRDFVSLMTRADLIISDSGGIQEEAPYLNVPVLVTRDVTDRPESVDAGLAQLVDSDAGSLRAVAERFLADGFEVFDGTQPTDIYGDGRSAQRIVTRLERLMRGSKTARHRPMDRLLIPTSTVTDSDLTHPLPALG